MNSNSTLALSVVVVLVGLAVAPVGAAAASPQPTPERLGQTVAQTQPVNQTGEQIDSEVSLVSSSYSADSGTVTLVFESDSARAVTLSDAGGFIDGGKINRRTLVLSEGRTTVEFAVTETPRGYVGVSISTESVLYAEVIQSPSVSPFQGSTGTVGWFGGAAIVLLSFVGAALWKLHKEGGEPVEATP